MLRDDAFKEVADALRIASIEDLEQQIKAEIPSWNIFWSSSIILLPVNVSDGLFTASLTRMKYRLPLYPEWENLSRTMGRQNILCYD